MKLWPLEGVGAPSVEGTSIPREPDGSYDVPATAVADLLSNGFTNIPPGLPAASPAPAAPPLTPEEKELQEIAAWLRANCDGETHDFLGLIRDGLSPAAAAALVWPPHPAPSEPLEDLLAPVDLTMDTSGYPPLVPLVDVDGGVKPPIPAPAPERRRGGK